MLARPHDVIATDCLADSFLVQLPCLPLGGQTRLRGRDPRVLKRVGAPTNHERPRALRPSLRSSALRPEESSQEQINQRFMKLSTVLSGVVAILGAVSASARLAHHDSAGVSRLT